MNMNMGLVNLARFLIFKTSKLTTMHNYLYKILKVSLYSPWEIDIFLASKKKTFCCTFLKTLDLPPHPS